MKVIINNAALLPIIKKAATILNEKSMRENLLCFTASNHLDIYAQGIIGLSYEAIIYSLPDDPGVVVVPGTMFYKLIKTFKPEAQTLLELKGDKLVVKCGTSSIKLPTINPMHIEDGRAKKTDTDELTPQFVVNTKQFSKAIKRVKYAIGQESSLDGLNYLCLQENPNSGPSITLKGLNGHIFMQDNVAYSEGTPEKEINYLIHRDKIDVITKIMNSEETSLYFNDKMLYVCGDDDSLIMTRAFYEFPPTDNFLSKFNETSSECKFKKQDMLDSLKRIQLLATDVENTVKLSFTKNHIQASIVTEKGCINECIPCEFQGTLKSIGFKNRHLIDLLESFTEDELILCMTTDEGPAKIVSTEDETENYLVVLMPIKELNSEYTEETETEE
ncbi:MAG: hypothetical protein IJU79_02795 [Desulfovibrionaceae bacterium]|nr:hypothetical protein [Desulfovibrionaceae bacterium]